jgi:hypothetical protein
MLWRVSRAGLLVLPTVVAGVLGAYAAELYLHLTDNPVATKDAKPRDGRSRLEVVQDLRAQGQDAYPAIFPRALLQAGPDGRLHSVIDIDGKQILPLGGISGSTTVTCNEGGQYPIYQSDEHGFNNPLGLWQAAPLQIAVLGDSYTYGNCVAAEDTFVAHLRSRYPATLNLGLGGVGPLIELAVLREYGSELRPRIVLWVLYEGNDLLELEEERHSDFLMAQLAGDPPQGLRGQQAVVDAALKSYVAAQLDTFSPPPEPFVQFLRLSQLRQRLQGLWRPGGEVEAPEQSHDFGLLRQVFAAARATTSSWGGELIIVYLPGRDRYFGPTGGAAANDLIRAGTIAAAKEIELPVLDLVPAFAARESPADLFVNANSHLNEIGYRVVAQAILSELPLTGSDLAVGPEGALSGNSGGDSGQVPGNTIQ